MARGWFPWFLRIGLMCFITNVRIVAQQMNLINGEDFEESTKRLIHSWDYVSSVWNYAWPSPREINFLLYTRDNMKEPYTLEIGNYEGLIESPLRLNGTTKIIIHGWLDLKKMDWVYNFRNDYLAAGDYNIIIVDWDSISWKYYFSVADSTPKVGKEIAELLKFLNLYEYINLEDVHIVGHSLGAHIAGFAGSILKGEIGRITGLDPAGPAFEVSNSTNEDKRLDSSDAKFVDVIHTSGGNVGYASAIGHVDFYPNEGISPQPGCSIMGSWMCSHLKAHKYMLESIKFPKAFTATKCKDWENYKSNNCKKGKTTYMGEKVDLNARGSYFMETNDKRPYGKGFVTFRIYIC